MATVDLNPTEPPANCGRCPRLRAYLDALASAHPDWFNRPVPTFGPTDAELLIVGLAPGAKGANRTGRPFTGDAAGDLLYPTLAKTGFLRGTYRASPDDGIQLINCQITNAVRCVPPANKPIGTEIATCRDYLSATLHGLKNLKLIVALGRIAHQSVLSALAAKQKDFQFKHGTRHNINGLALLDSFHCSRYNTNTGRLTPQMFEAIFETARATLKHD